MKIRNIYYVIWSDIIVAFRKRSPELNEGEVNTKLLIFVSTVNAMSIWVVGYLFKIFGIFEFEQLQINIFHLKGLDNSLSFFIQYVSPFFVINYFLIFYKKRYRLLIDKYQSKKNRYGDLYILSVVIFTAIIVFAWGFYTGNIFK